jgi:hypothetical protein
MTSHDRYTNDEIRYLPSVPSQQSRPWNFSWCEEMIDKWILGCELESNNCRSKEDSLSDGELVFGEWFYSSMITMLAVTSPLENSEG